MGTVFPYSNPEPPPKSGGVGILQSNLASSIPVEDYSSQDPAAQALPVEGPGAGQPGRSTGREAALAGDPPNHNLRGFRAAVSYPRAPSLTDPVPLSLLPLCSFYITDTDFLWVSTSRCE